MGDKLYRPRGVYNKTKRDSWITTVWYRSRADAEEAVEAFGAKRRYSDIRIVSSSNRHYKGKYIRKVER